MNQVRALRFASPSILARWHTRQRCNVKFAIRVASLPARRLPRFIGAPVEEEDVFKEDARETVAGTTDEERIFTHRAAPNYSITKYIKDFMEQVDPTFNIQVWYDEGKMADMKQKKRDTDRKGKNKA